MFPLFCTDYKIVEFEKDPVVKKLYEHHDLTKKILFGQNNLIEKIKVIALSIVLYPALAFGSFPSSAYYAFTRWGARLRMKEAENKTQNMVCNQNIKMITVVAAVKSDRKTLYMEKIEFNRPKGIKNKDFTYWKERLNKGFKYIQSQFDNAHFSLSEKVLFKWNVYIETENGSGLSYEK